MWDRKVVKQKAKDRLKVGYWKMVLVGLLMALFIGGYGGSSANSATSRIRQEVLLDDHGSEAYGYGDYSDYMDPEKWLERELRGNSGALSNRDMSFLLTAILSTGIMIGIIGGIFAIALSAFVFNPLCVGGKKFFLRNIEEEAELKELAAGFDKNYLNVVKILFFRDLFVFLWSLLFVIPGIIKAYEYRMIPYLLAENPDMSKEDAFAISRRMMDGNKMNVFVFDLSFIGWWLLGSLTFNIVDLFYVNPYYFQADAMLYDAIKIDDQNRNGTYRTQSQTFDSTPTDGMQY